MTAAPAVLPRCLRVRLVEIVERGLREGKDWGEIAVIVNRKLGLSLSPEELRRIYEYAKANNRDREGDGPGFSYPDVQVGSVEDEVLEVYRLAKSRLLALRRLEEKINAPLPETDRVLSTAIGALKLLAELKSSRRDADAYIAVLERVLGQGGGDD